MKKVIIFICGFIFAAKISAQTWDCGDENNKLKATFANGTLTISGRGTMKGYLMDVPPWYDFRDSILTVNFESGVLTVGNGAFSDCVHLTNVIFPEYLGYIGHAAFENCKSLTSINFPNSLLGIGAAAFAGCSELTHATILSHATLPNNFTSMGVGAFSGCSKLRTITIPNPKPPNFYPGEEPENVSVNFGGMDLSNIILYVPQAAIASYRSAVGWKEFRYIHSIGSKPTPPTSAKSVPEITWHNMLKQAISANPTNTWDTGNRYKGQNMSNGMGAFLWGSGTMYFGSFIENKKNGYGINIVTDGKINTNCPDCKYYVGNWSNDLKSGAGACYDASGKLLYRGEFSEDWPVGVYPLTDENAAYKFEIINYDDRKYIGETCDGRRHGYGILVWQTGDLWFGWMKDGARDGAGLHIYKNGNLLSGTWKGDTHYQSVTDKTWHDILKKAISTNPRHTWDDGERYKGQDRTNGMGAYLWSNGRMYLGSYRENKQNGYGIYMAPEGNTIINCPDCKYYAGNWSNGDMNGDGSCYDATGKLLYRGEFKDDRPVGAYPSTDNNAAYRLEVINDGGVTYVGETFNGHRHGYGIIVWQNGELWLGWFKDGLRDGAGLAIQSNGNLLTGTWKGNTHYQSVTDKTWRDILKKAISTNPRHTWDDGERYKGQDRTNGMGAYLWNVGSMYFGSYRENKQNGYGIYMASDGYIVTNCPDCKFYAGNWSNGDMNGDGACYDATGKLLYRGEFRDNRPVGVYPSTGDNAAYRLEVINDGGVTYVGETCDRRRNGNGILAWQNGDLWLGWWKDDARNGAGLHIYNSGNFLSGTWEGDTHTQSATGITWRDLLKQAISAHPRHTWDNGDRYKGQDRTNGMGAYLWSNGSMYFGSNKENKTNGYGIFIVSDGSTISNCPDCVYYAGNWSNGEKSGTGSCYDATGKLLYSGEFRKDGPVGVYPSTGNLTAYKFEIFNYDGGKYIGATSNGRIEGYGIRLWQSGDFWLGWWKDDDRDGDGLYIFNNGNLLTGTWKGDKRTPPASAENATEKTWRDMLKQAIINNPANIWDLGDRYKGQDRTNGMGAFHFSNGDMYFGRLRDNKRDGFGIYIASDRGTINNCIGCKYYAGNWSNGIKSGAGSCYNETGKLLYRGVFMDDRPVGSYPSTGDNAAYGFTIINYNDGTKHIGESINGRRDGYGIIVWPTGELWLGWCKDGIRDGAGLMIYNNGNLSTGTWKGNTYTPIVSDIPWHDMLKQAISANPRHAWDNGDRYKGQDRANGIGATLWSDGNMYFGSYRENKRNGDGIYIAPDGQTILHCPDCKYYAGNWSNDEKTDGSCYDANGKLLYLGKFSNDRPVDAYPTPGRNASFKFEFKIINYNDGKYIGETLNGNRHGNGILVWLTGDLWFGSFMSGSRDGAGLLINNDGNVLSGSWKGDTHTPTPAEPTVAPTATPTTATPAAPTVAPSATPTTTPSAGQAVGKGPFEVYQTGLGGGYGLAFGQDNVLYATGRDSDKSVLWKITASGQKEVHAILDYGDPMVGLAAPPTGLETNIVVDGVGNVWISGKVNGQSYVVSRAGEPRAVYLNQHISIPIKPKDDDAKGYAWDEVSGKLYVITSGPTSRLSTDAIRHLTTLTPSVGKFAEELGTERNGWSKPPLYIKNEGTLIEQAGIALVKAKGSPLFLIGHDRVFVLPATGKASPFGKAFTGVRLYGGAADESGNLYVSVNNAENPDNGKGAVYRLDKSGNASLLIADIGKPLGLAWHEGYLYIMEQKGDRVLRMKTTK